MEQHPFFSFRLGGAQLALPIDLVVEVIPRVLHTVLPDQPAGVLGLLNFHGRPVALLDSVALLGIATESQEEVAAADEETAPPDSGEFGEEEENYYVVLETPEGLVALGLDVILGIEPLESDPTGMEKILPRNYPVKPRLVSRVAYSGSQPVFILDSSRVFSSEEMRALYDAGSRRRDDSSKPQEGRESV